MDLLLHGDLLEVGLDGESSLVCRLLKQPKGDLAFCVQDGRAHPGGAGAADAIDGIS